MNAFIEINADAHLAVITNVPPTGYFTRDDGIYILKEDEEEGQSCEEWLCSPIEVLARGCKADGTGWIKKVQVTDSKGRGHVHLISEARLARSAASVLSELRDIGLDVASGSASRKELLKLLNDWKPSAMFSTTNRLGWTGPSCAAFVLGDKRVLGDPNFLFHNDDMPEAASEMHPLGDLSAWRENVAAPCIGNPVLTLAVCVAFASPLLEPMGLEGSGFHLRGASSSGKTTALAVANSVWGNPRSMQGWRTTAIALEGIAAAYNGSLLTLDELGQVSAKVADAAAYTLASGKGKRRATSTGKLQTGLSWKLMLLSSGEISLAAYSGVIRPPIPKVSGHPFQFYPATDSGASGHPVM